MHRVGDDDVCQVLLLQPLRVEGSYLRLIDLCITLFRTQGWLAGRGTARAEDPQGTPTQRVSPSVLTYED